MGKRHSAAGMCVSNYIKAIFTSILMGVLVVVSSIVLSDGLKQPKYTEGTAGSFLRISSGAEHII